MLFYERVTGDAARQKRGRNVAPIKSGGAVRYDRPEKIAPSRKGEAFMSRCCQEDIGTLPDNKACGEDTLDGSTSTVGMPAEPLVIRIFLPCSFPTLYRIVDMQKRCRDLNAGCSAPVRRDVFFHVCNKSHGFPAPGMHQRPHFRNAGRRDVMNNLWTFNLLGDI